jgi:hypothetical protein
MSTIKAFFASRTGIISVGAFIGVVAALLQKWGNPGNMGICVACFEGDMAGAMGLHRAEVVQYLRPEILGFVLGALISAYIFKEFHARAGSAPIVRFILGMTAMIGALVFLGCPWRALLRLAGGDGNAIFGILGLAAGIGIGALFFKSGYNLGRTQKTYPAVGWLLPLVVLGQFKPGFAGQPVAHTMELWNFLGMALAGLAFALAGGCPGRQLFMAGEGDGDAAVFALGMVGGAAVSHNFGLASSPAGVGPNGIAGVIICFLVLLFIGFTMRQKV